MSEPIDPAIAAYLRRVAATDRDRAKRLWAAIRQGSADAARRRAQVTQRTARTVPVPASGVRAPDPALVERVGRATDARQAQLPVADRDEPGDAREPEWPAQAEWGWERV
jgi:hypothetical protein